MVKLITQRRKLEFLKIFLFLAFIAICDMRYAICELFAQDKIVAIVNKDVITQKDFNDLLNFMCVQLSTEYKGKQLETKIQSMKLDLLDKLIEDRLILQEAKKNNIKIDQGRVKARIEEIKKHYESDREFQDALAKQGLVQADIESKIKEQLLMYTIIDAKIRNKIIVNPGEVTDFYQENREKFKLPEEREFESITIDNENLAPQVYDSLRKGEDFQGVVERYSLAVNKFNTQGEQLRKDIEEKIFKLQIGEISTPIKIEDSYYIFKLNNIIPCRQQNLSEAQDNIYIFLFNKKMEEGLAKWLDELKKHAYIKILQN
jgi:parvulin-like peptidyl-prolyl isomerase